MDISLVPPPPSPPNPALHNFFTGQVIFQGSAVTTISIEDSNLLHNLSSFTLPSPLSALTSYSVTLDNPVASIVLATPINDSFSFSLTVTNDIVLLAASSITLTGDASSLSLTSTNGNVNLFGAIHVNGARLLPLSRPSAPRPATSMPRTVPINSAPA